MNRRYQAHPVGPERRYEMATRGSRRAVVLDALATVALICLFVVLIPALGFIAGAMVGMDMGVVR